MTTTTRDFNLDLSHCIESFPHVSAVGLMNSHVTVKPCGSFPAVTANRRQTAYCCPPSSLGRLRCDFSPTSSIEWRNQKYVVLRFNLFSNKWDQVGLRFTFLIVIFNYDKSEMYSCRTSRLQVSSSIWNSSTKARSNLLQVYYPAVETTSHLETSK